MGATLGAAAAEVTLGELARRDFTWVREEWAVFDVIARMRRRGAGAALVIPRRGFPQAGQVLGVITKEHIADSVAASIGLYPG
jgi:CIC family chloride channel protein